MIAGGCEAPTITAEVAAVPIADRSKSLRAMRTHMRLAWSKRDASLVKLIAPHLAALDWLVANGHGNAA